MTSFFLSDRCQAGYSDKEWKSMWFGCFIISSQHLRMTGYMTTYKTAPGTGPGSRIQPLIWVWCDPIAARWLFLCYGCDDWLISQAEPSSGKTSKEDTLKSRLKKLFPCLCLFLNFFVSQFDTLPSLDGPTVLHMKEAKNTFYAWLGRATA